MSDVTRFKAENPDWADLPDEAVEKSYAYATWSLHRATSDAWVTIKEELARTLNRLRGKWR